MGKRRSSFVADDNDAGDERPAKVSKVKQGGAGPEVDDDGNTFWELSNKRRVTISEFKGSVLVNIREFYQDASGAMKPGKKGISLSVEQYKAVADLVPSINDELRKSGVNIDGEEVDADEADEKTAKSTRSSKSVSKKANIEATSDEDD